MRVFLRAAWRDLILLNFPVPDAVLSGRLPPGVTLDRYQGSAYVSLVAFDFVDTRVLGLRWPLHTNFPEVNLRFYVRDGDRRGVVFVRELVPQHLTAWAARLLYNEPYRAARIDVATEPAAKTFRLHWGGRIHTIGARLGADVSTPPADGCEHFFKEHEWGFGTTRGGKKLVYRVEHPVWAVRPVVALTLDLDFAAVYGPEWGFLNGAAPASQVFALGSDITVFGYTR
jgi:uncharacterized protein YqjF (DUF2071 family)